MSEAWVYRPERTAAEIRSHLIFAIDLWDCGNVESFTRVLDRYAELVRSEAAAADSTSEGGE